VYNTPNPGEVLEYDASLPKELIFTVSGIEIRAVFDSVYYAYSNITDEIMKEETKMAKYMVVSITGENTDGYDDCIGEVYYNVSTQRIVGLNGIAIPRYANAQLTDEEVLEIVEKDVINLYGKEFLSKYSHVISEFTSKNGWSYQVTFIRTINGIQTQEQIRFTYNGEGKLASITGRYLGLFDDIEVKITEDLQNEVNERANKLLDGRIVNPMKIYATPDGTVFIYYVYYKREGDFKYPDSKTGEFYIEVNINVR
jgi:hypothetical protein